MRIKRAQISHKHRKRRIRKAKGFLHSRSKKFKAAKVALFKAGNYAYRDRRNKKRSSRRLWTLRINAACRENGTTYSAFSSELKKSKIEIDRKILQQLAQDYPDILKKIFSTVKKTS